MAAGSYILLDSGHMRKLEQVGPYRLVRPAAQAVWKPRLANAAWDEAHAEFFRHKNGGGEWVLRQKKASLPAEWLLELHHLTMGVRLTEFGHIGIFPEHHEASALKAAIASQQAEGTPFRLLNLFAYTGALSLLAASWGAQVTHLDASKTSVAWGRKNAEQSKLSHLAIRWIVDDVKKFVAREVRRGASYEAIVLDPPSFGRGAKGEVWKIEDDIVELIDELAKLRSKDFAFWQLSAHSPGFTPLVLQNLLGDICRDEQGAWEAFEMSVREANNGRALASGACCRYSFHRKAP